MTFTEDEIIERLMKAYLKAREKERSNPSQLKFEINLEKNLYDLKIQLMKRRYKPLPLICFIIDYPVKREIFAPNFKDRVISHFLFDLINPIFEKTFIYDTYSCRKGKGTLFGIKRAEHHIRSCTNNYKKEAYCLKLDISGYFMSIDKKILYDTLLNTLNKFKDRISDNGKKWSDIIDFDLTEYIIKVILTRDPLENVHMLCTEKEREGLPPNKCLANSPKGVGIIIGDVISQLFSNIYLNSFDNYIKRELKCKHYCRYVDDSLIIHESKEFLKNLIPIIYEYLKNNFHLNLNLKKTRITSTSQNVYFLGACLRPFRKYPLSRSIKEAKKKINFIKKDINNKKLSNKELLFYRSSINSYLGYFKHFKTFKIKQKLLEDVSLKKYFSYSKGYNKAKIK